MAELRKFNFQNVVANRWPLWLSAARMREDGSLLVAQNFDGP